MGTDDKGTPVTDTDMNPAGPHGVGESITAQGNELAHDAADEEHQRGDTDRGRASASARDPEREANRLQGSVDPTRPGPEPGD